MLHGIICPATWLRMFAVQSKYHLILPHLFDESVEYFEFYKERASQGDFVLCDNSIFELGHSIEGTRLLEMAESVCATEVVAPEVWNDAVATRKLTEEFIAHRDSKGSYIRILAMATGENINEIVQSFFEWNKHPSINSLGLPFVLDFEVKGISDNLKSKTLRRVLNRWHLVDRINAYANATQIPIKPTHLMGLSDPVELQRYKSPDYYWVRSNDSSSAFVHGVNEIRLTERGLPCEKISQKLDFTGYPELRPSQIDAVYDNIKTIKSWL